MFPSGPEGLYAGGGRESRSNVPLQVVGMRLRSSGRERFEGGGRKAARFLLLAHFRHRSSILQKCPEHALWLQFLHVSENIFWQ